MGGYHNLPQRGNGDHTRQRFGPDAGAITTIPEIRDYRRQQLRFWLIAFA